MSAPSTRRELRAAERAQSAVTVATTPGARQIWKRGKFWLGLAIVAALLLLLAAALRGGSGTAQSFPLDPRSAAPIGSKALVETLRSHGVTVSIPETLAEASAADRAHSTLILNDSAMILEDGELRSLIADFGRVVLLSPNFEQLLSLGEGASAAGASGSTQNLRGSCTATGSAQSITPGELLWPGSGKGCFGDPDNGYTIVETPAGIFLLDSPALLQNDTLAAADNAAAILTLLGSEPNLVWYHTNLVALSAPEVSALGAATPAWVVPAIMLLMVTTLAAMFWRGRRFGALVSERLPVTVPSDETMRGRGALYQRIGAHEEAVRALRLGSLDRCARALGLPARSSPETVALAIAARLQRDPAPILEAMATGSAGSERELLRLVSVLREVEEALGRSLDPRSTRPSTTER